MFEFCSLEMFSIGLVLYLIELNIQSSESTQKMDSKLCNCEQNNFSSTSKDKIVESNDLRYVGSVFFKYLKPNATDSQSSNKYDYEYYYVCAGIILNPYYFLTAAQCLDVIERNPEDTFFVAAGADHDLKRLYADTNLQSKVKGIIRHPKYKINIYDRTDSMNDIGLINLAEKLELGQKTNIYPACIFDGKINVTDNELFTAGYALKTNQTCLATAIQYYGDLKNENQSKVKMDDSIYLRINILKQQALNCSHKDVIWGTSSSACKSDIGGPLLYSNGSLEVIGITSISHLEKSSDYKFISPGLYITAAVISLYLDYIKMQTADDLCLKKFPIDRSKMIKNSQTPKKVADVILILLFAIFSIVVLSFVNLNRRNLRC